jgi:hypothetical protein
MRYLIFILLSVACSSPQKNIERQLKEAKDSLQRSMDFHKALNESRAAADGLDDFKTSNAIYFQLDSLMKVENRLSKRIDSLTDLLKK